MTLKRSRHFALCLFSALLGASLILWFVLPRPTAFRGKYDRIARGMTTQEIDVILGSAGHDYWTDFPPYDRFTGEHGLLKREKGVIWELSKEDVEHYSYGKPADKHTTYWIEGWEIAWVVFDDDGKGIKKCFEQYYGQSRMDKVFRYIEDLFE